jgi:hypothetical protein
MDQFSVFEFLQLFSLKAEAPVEESGAFVYVSILAD